MTSQRHGSALSGTITECEDKEIIMENLTVTHEVVITRCVNVASNFDFMGNFVRVRKFADEHIEVDTGKKIVCSFGCGFEYRMDKDVKKSRALISAALEILRAQP